MTVKTRVFKDKFILQHFCTYILLYSIQNMLKYKYNFRVNNA